jgi:opacity protein-like surface antigen
MLSICAGRARGAARIGAAACVVTLVLCLAAGVAEAQSGKGDYVGAWSVTGAFGYAVPNTDQYGNDLTGRLGIGYSPYPPLEIGLELGLFSSEVAQPEANGLPTHDIASGKLDVIPACVTLRYRAPLAETMATLVLLAGGGYYFIDYTMAAAPRGILVGGGAEGLPDQAVRDAWGFHAGAGLEYALTGWLSLTIEGRYVVVAPKVSGTAGEGHQLGGSLDLNTWLFTGGIKVAF